MKKVCLQCEGKEPEETGIKQKNKYLYFEEVYASMFCLSVFLKVHSLLHFYLKYLFAK